MYLNDQYSPQNCGEKIEGMLRNIPGGNRRLVVSEAKERARRVIQHLVDAEINAADFQMAYNVLDHAFYRMGYLYEAEQEEFNRSLVKSPFTKEQIEQIESLVSAQVGDGQHIFELTISLTQWFIDQNWTGREMSSALELALDSAMSPLRPPVAASEDDDEQLAQFMRYLQHS